MRRRIAFAVAALLFVEAAVADDAQQDLKNLTGTWQAVSVERAGEAVPQAEVAKVRLIVEGKDYIFKTGKQTIEGTHRLDPSKDPKMIDAVRTKGPDKGMTLHGIYELDRDTFRVCFSAPEKARPSEFRTGGEGGLRLFVFKRVKGTRR